MTTSAPRHIQGGIFLAPFHPVRENPTLAIERDMELIVQLEKMNYAEAWIGEHHSGGYEIIASPELFIAGVAERTSRIKLGTGVVSLSYHHPLMVANRIIQLDHQTRGRVMFGAGPGLLPSDATQLGIQPMDQRRRLAESLDVILRLLQGETVTEKTDWYELQGARAHFLPYSSPHPEVAVASSVTPSGGKLAGKYNLSMLCVASTSSSGFDALDTNWKLAQSVAKENGFTMTPQQLRLVGPMHIAETREQAMANVQFGIHDWIDYFAQVNPMGASAEGDPIAAMIESDMAVIGTPDDAIAQLERLWKKTGGFGTFLQLAHNWANFDNTLKSYDMFSRYVLPHFNQQNATRAASFTEVSNRKLELSEMAAQAALKQFEEQ